ncbi:MAG: hypothetical protein K0S47_3132 [Herbinix sp.]|jgi:hypothetical protein|nr:hypothetical protein [Herbinix sp.]
MKIKLHEMKKSLFLISAFCFVVLVFLLFLTRGSNELLGGSNVVSTPCDGVSLEVSVTAKYMTYTIRSQEIDYIIYDGFQSSMRLEMLQAGRWYVVSCPKLHIDMPEPVSPGNDCTRTIRWKDYLKYNLSDGKYRLIFTFWTMKDGKQSKNYNAITEFAIN